MDTKTKTKFTPGPWTYEKTYETIWVWDSLKNKIIMHVSNEEDLKTDVKETNEANARLIAAAPEMYELLRKGLEDGEPMNWDEVDELLDRITNA